MACLDAIKGIELSCDSNLAGVREAWIGDFDAFVATVGTGAAAHTIATFARKSASGTEVLYHYGFAKQTGSLNSEMTKDEANGTLYYTNTIALQFNRLEAEKHMEIEALAKGQLIVIVRDNNNKYWYCGYDSYVSADAATAATGQSFDDLNGYTTSLSTMSAFLPFEIEFATFEALVDGYVEPED